MADARLDPTGETVAEKASSSPSSWRWAIAVGAVITKAVTGDATNISHQITASHELGRTDISARIVRWPLWR